MTTSKVCFLYLSAKEIVDTGVTVADVTELCTESLRAHGENQVENPAKIAIHPLPEAFFHAMPAWLKQKDECGLKWVSGFPTNVQKKLPTIAGIIVINDTTTGFPLAVMDGTYITAIRTAGVSVVASKYLARKNSEVLSIIGTGVQGKYHALCLPNILPSIKVIRIYDQWQPSVQSFKDVIGKVYGDKMKIEAMNSCEEAIKGGDIVVTATGKLLQPIFFEKWVKPGALVLPIHTGGWEQGVIEKMDKVVSDDWAQFEAFGKPIYSIPDGPHTSLGEIVAGKKLGRENDQQRIIDFNVGLAIHDIIIGTEIFKKAKSKGLGIELELMDMSSPIPLPPLK